MRISRLVFLAVVYTVPTGGSLNGIVGKNTDAKRQIMNGHRGNDIGYDGTMKTVSAGDIWNKEKMMEMLGVEEIGEDFKKSDDFGGLENQSDQVPTILADLYQKMNEAGSNVAPLKCRIPGMKGNVVRVLSNKGNILHESQRHTIVELQFSLKNSLHKYENITEATLQIVAPVLEERHWWTLLTKSDVVSTPQIKYDVYFSDDGMMKELREKILEWKSTAVFFDNNISEEVAEIFGLPIAETFYTPTLKENAKKVKINAKNLVEKWRRLFFEKNRRTISRAILVVTMETDTVTEKRCVQIASAKPRLLLVSHDRRQCPLPVTSYVNGDVTTGDVKMNSSDGIVRKRKKRSVGKKKAEKKKSRKKTKSSSSESFAKIVRDESDANRGAELVEGVSLHSSRMRSARSTICRRHPMYIRFDRMGWGGWIIAPRGFQAYRCAGECPFPLGGRLNGTNHAVLMTMMHSIQPWNSALPCCVPTSLAAISILYFDTTGTVVLREYEDMMVNSCGCR